MESALRLRPRGFDDLLGQPHICARGSMVRTLCEQGSLQHLFFYGPPGCGKTSLARVIAQVMGRPFFELNATSFKIEALRKIIDTQTPALIKPVIFIDEVHRLAKNQQEVLLPIMEEHSALILGASTENPFMSLTAAIRSRSFVIELYPLDNAALKMLLDRAYPDCVFEEGAQATLIQSVAGDGRVLLNTMDALRALAHETITLEALQQLRNYRGGSSEAREHYDLTSALIKSIRGSDPDAAIYYLARLIEGGEGAEFIARRLVILASEDVGNAHPQGLILASSALSSVQRIGYPEARIILAQVVIYLCASPKSNSAYEAINRAQELVREGVMLPVPTHLRTHPQGYRYPHAYGGWVDQEYLSTPLELVHLKECGYEAKMKQWLDEVWKRD